MQRRLGSDQQGSLSLLVKNRRRPTFESPAAVEATGKCAQVSQTTAGIGHNQHTDHLAGVRELVSQWLTAPPQMIHCHPSDRMRAMRIHRARHDRWWRRPFIPLKPRHEPIHGRTLHRLRRGAGGMNKTHSEVEAAPSRRERPTCSGHCNPPTPPSTGIRGRNGGGTASNAF